MTTQEMLDMENTTGSFLTDEWLENKFITKEEASPNGRKRFTDSEVSCLSVDVFYTGTKSFRYRVTINGERYEKTLGKFPKLTVNEARIKAIKLGKRKKHFSREVEEKYTRELENKTFSENYNFNKKEKSHNKTPYIRTESPYNPVEPTHYTDMAISPLEYIEANQECFNWATANVIKYVSRHKAKKGIEDLRKAAWYLNHEIERLEKELK